jgi:hypothetical protein
MTYIPKYILVIIIVLVVNIQCSDLDSKHQQWVSLDYNHPNSNSRYVRTANRTVRLQEIEVKNGNKIEASATLINNQSSVKVPINVSLIVEYKSWTQEQPDIYYEYGSSGPFIVTRNSPDIIVVTVVVSVNPNYPAEEDMTDNVTVIDNATYTDNATWGDNFTYNTASTQEQKTVWEDFWDNLSTSDNWSYISVGHIDNMSLFCDNTTVVSQIITQLQNDNNTNWTSACDNVSWVTGGCGQGIELKATTLSDTRDCRCNNPGDNVTTIRPAIKNRNWGGVGDSCTAPTQSLEVILKK